AVYEGVTRGILVIGDWITRDDGCRAFIATPVTSGGVSSTNGLDRLAEE
ncbi:uncharacterized protein METZ01_LOCUS372404, partial [marine metagenome]